jgi:hypothetical protein
MIDAPPLSFLRTVLSFDFFALLAGCCEDFIAEPLRQELDEVVQSMGGGPRNQNNSDVRKKTDRWNLVAKRNEPSSQVGPSHTANATSQAEMTSNDASFGVTEARSP